MGIKAGTTSLIAFFVIAVFSISLTSCTKNVQQGAGVGAAVGATAGALIDDDNPWRGAVVGGVVNAFGGAEAVEQSPGPPARSADP